MDAEWWDIVNAIAQSVGAIGTTGALLVAAFTYRRQVAERRTAQARHVRAAYGPSHLELHNDSDAPIYSACPARVHRRYNTLAKQNGVGDFETVEMYVGRGLVIRPESPRRPDHLVGRRGRVDPGGVLSVNMPDRGVNLARYGWIFRDDDGRHWIRLAGNGALAPVTFRAREITRGAWRFRLLDRALALNARIRGPRQ